MKKIIRNSRISLNKKLALRSETIVVLRPEQLGSVAGASGVWSCTDICSTTNPL